MLSSTKPRANKKCSKKEKKPTNFVFCLAETAALRCANLPGSPQIHSSFFPPTFSNSEAVLKSAIGRHRICTACISVLGIHPPAPKPKQKKLILIKQNNFDARMPKRRASQTDRQTDTPSSFRFVSRRRCRRGEASFHRFHGSMLPCYASSTVRSYLLVCTGEPPHEPVERRAAVIRVPPPRRGGHAAVHVPPPLRGGCGRHGPGVVPAAPAPAAPPAAPPVAPAAAPPLRRRSERCCRGQADGRRRRRLPALHRGKLILLLLAWRVAGPGGGARARFEHDLELLLHEVLRRLRVGEATGERVRANGGGRSVLVGAAAADAAELHTEEVRERRAGQRDGGAAQRAGWVAPEPRVHAAGVEGVAAGGQEAELVVVAERALAHGAVARRLGHRGQRRGQREQRQARDEPLRLRRLPSSCPLAVGGRHGRHRRGVRHERERRSLSGRRGGGHRWARVAAEVADEVVDAQRRKQHHHHDDCDDEDARRNARHAPAPASSRTTPPRVTHNAPAAIVRQPRHQWHSPLWHRRRRRGRDGGRCHQVCLSHPAPGRALSS
jgi:hypothetical protein